MVASRAPVLAGLQLRAVPGELGDHLGAQPAALVQQGLADLAHPLVDEVEVEHGQEELREAQLVGGEALVGPALRRVVVHDVPVVQHARQSRIVDRVHEEVVAADGVERRKQRDALVRLAVEGDVAHVDPHRVHPAEHGVVLREGLQAGASEGFAHQFALLLPGPVGRRPQADDLVVDLVVEPLDLGDVHGELADERRSGDRHGPVLLRRFEGVLGERAAHLARAPADAEQLVVDREDGGAVHGLVSAVRVAAVHRLAVERGGDQEGPVGAGAVGDPLGQHQPGQQLRIGETRGVDSALQEDALRLLIEQVDGDVRHRFESLDDRPMRRVRALVGGVEDHDVHVDVEGPGPVRGLHVQGRDRVAARAVRRQGQADSPSHAVCSSFSVAVMSCCARSCRAASCCADSCQERSPSSFSPSSFSSARP